MPDGINELSPEIRDFLLNRNLILSDTVTDNGLTSLAVGLGSQVNLNELSDSVLPSEDLVDSAVNFRNSNVSRNRYTSIEDMVSATLINNSYSYNQVDGGYIDENRQLNIGGPSTDALDIVTSVTSQEGFGLGSNGFYPQNNVNTSITGRVLGGLGAINDTPLGIIGGQQLLFSLAQKAAFNTQRELLGKINLQPFSLLRGAEFLNPDYSITVSSSTGGRILDTALDLGGFQLPISPIDAGASIFEDSGLFNTNSIDRNNSLIRNTGKGQILRLFEILNKNQYRPAYNSDRNDDRLAIEFPNDYGPITSGVTLLELSSEPTVGSFPTFQSPEFDGSDKIWQQNVSMGRENSLLYKTKELFNDRVFYVTHLDLQGTPKTDFTQLATASGGRYSKGSGVLSEDFLFNEDKENVFCRTWNSNKSYSTVADLQKNTGLKDNPLRVRNNLDASVLGDNGFVKVSPYNIPTSGAGEADAKKFMFSIENLAWDDNKAFLPEFETGAGDPVTGTKGRIMWFPPYDIKFNETTSVNWDKSEFIGRGEPIYTYNNTERSGQLSFKVIIDHPDYLNDRNLTSDEVIASITAGCLDYEKYFSVAESNQIQSELNSAAPIGQTVPANQVEEPEDLFFYFPNDVATLSKYPNYEVSSTTQPNPTLPDVGYNSTLPSSGYTNSTNYGLNDSWNDSSYLNALEAILTENEGFTVKVFGYASAAGLSEANQRLSDDRASAVETWLKSELNSDLKIVKSEAFGDSQSNSSGSVDSKEVKEERFVRVEFKYEPKLDSTVFKGAEVKKEEVNFNKEFAAKIKRRFHKESEYFEKLENSEVKSDKIIFETLKEKIKFFQPAFHSTTPEGFNSRLTFLQQCTRQGPTNAETKASNLAFGTPPVCILRIGDFYNTKIVIDSLALTFEPLVWDLNPEGIGVQPMIANVNINFKFIGGSSLRGPINKLQNAVSFNYFGNTEVYDPRADRFIPTQTDSESGLDLLEGAVDLREFLDDTDYPPSKINNVPLDKDQMDVVDVENSGEVSEPPTESISDKDILENIAWETKFNELVQEGTTNTFTFIYNSGFGFNIIGLSRSYNFRLKIKKTDETFQDVLTGTFGSVNTDNINSTTTWNQAEYGLGEQTFQLIITGGSVGTIRQTSEINVEY